MGDEPGRLVDDGDVGVLMDDGKRHRVGRKGGVAFQGLMFEIYYFISLLFVLISRF